MTDYQFPENASFTVEPDQIGLYEQHINELSDFFDTMSEIELDFQAIQQTQFNLFLTKHKHYGKDNISGGSDIDMTDQDNINSALFGIYVRMQDKLQRLKNMLTNGLEGTDETLIDTFADLANYATIATIVKNGRWK